MDLPEDLLSGARIYCGLFLMEKGIQGWIAVETIVCSSGREQVTFKQNSIVGINCSPIHPLRDVIPACYGA
jgi:hypothetical protein